MNFTRFRNTNDEQSAFGVRVRERGDRFLNLVLNVSDDFARHIAVRRPGDHLAIEALVLNICICRHSESGKMLREVLEDNAGIERQY